jgi:hypothetical protein
MMRRMLATVKLDAAKMAIKITHITENAARVK